MHSYRSHTCGALNQTHIGSSVRLSGWVHRIRDHGGVLFIDLRDHYGLTQVVADPDSPAFAVASDLRAEWVVRVDGSVRERPQGTKNPNLPTGEIEIDAGGIVILSQAQELPLPVFGDQDYPEDTRLRYRFLDLRRQRLHDNIMRRSAIVDAMRAGMKAAGFFEFQTPILTASSPEGARDYLVPSRVHPRKFYALPQAPQQYKQLIMMSGFDRYFQIAACFRDEDPRADRLPGEFYQLDVEMSFATQEDVLTAMEPVLRGVFEKFAQGETVTAQFPRITYAEAMRKYGTDKPDLRNPLEMQPVTEHFAGSGFRVFSAILARDDKACVWAIPAPGGGSRAFCDRMNGWAQREGQPGLGYILFRDGQGVGPIAKNLGGERVSAIRRQLGLADGDACFFVCGQPEHFTDFAAAARMRIARELNLIDEEQFQLAWIVDFPMFEWDQDRKAIAFSHNPFSMPQGELGALEGDTEALLAVRAHQYDLVCNGYEIGSGAIRNHRRDIMERVFAIAGYDPKILEERFGALYRAFSYGAPPHGGMAAGLDRIVMLLCGEKNLREVTLFPMNQQAEDLLMGAPSEISSQQLMELHIRSAAPSAKP